MAKRIQFTSKDIKDITDDIRRQLLGGNLKGGQVIVNTTINKKAVLSISPVAWAKMQALVFEFATEVQWHGTVVRTGKNSWLIKDVLNFPHTVSAASVESDLDEFNTWEDSLPIETQNEMRFHGHSHVYMDVNPSSIDMNFRNNRISLMPAASDTFDPFYIFMILNKSGDLSCSIYDKKNNVLYETSDITIDYTGADQTIKDFVDEAKKLAKPCPRPSVIIPPEWDYTEHRYLDGHSKKYSNKENGYYGSV